MTPPFTSASAATHLQPRRRHALGGLRQLLLADGDAGPAAAGGLHRADGEAAPAAADLQHVVAGPDARLGDQRVDLVQLALVQPARQDPQEAVQRGSRQIDVHTATKNKKRSRRSSSRSRSGGWRRRCGAHSRVAGALVHAGGVGEGLVQEQLVHGVAGIVVLLDVLAAACKSKEADWVGKQDPFKSGEPHAADACQCNTPSAPPHMLPTELHRCPARRRRPDEPI